MDAAAVLNDLEGRVVDGQFRLLCRLGGSEQSAVYLTQFDGNPPRMAALKLVAASAPDAEARLAGWVAAANLSHPNLLRVFHSGHCRLDGERFVYSVTEYAQEVLAEVLEQRPLTADETRETLGPVLDALRYLHAKGFVHGRLKPSNMVAINDCLKVSADCVALAAGGGTNRTGKEAYDAPELGRGKITPAADVWSLGMTLVCCLTQRLARWEPWTGQAPAIPAEIAEPFGEIARECLRVEPAERCSLETIRGAFDGELAPAGEKKPVPPVRRSRWTASIVAVGVLALVVAGALQVRSRQAHAPAATAAKTEALPAAGAQKPAHGTALGRPSVEGSTRPAAKAASASPGAAASMPDSTSAGVLKRVIPDVLPEAQRTIRGHVLVRVRVSVDANGSVTDAALETASGSNYFNRLALEAARQWEFAAPKSGETAQGTWAVQFDFTHNGVEAGARPK